MRSWSRSSLSSSWSNASRMASRSGRLKNWFTLFHSAHHTSKTSHFNRHIWTPLPLRHHLLSPKMPNHHRAAPYRVQTPALSTDQSATARIPSPLLSKSCRPLLSNEYDQARGIYNSLSRGMHTARRALHAQKSLYLLHSFGVVLTLSSCASFDLSIYGRIHMAFCNACIFFGRLLCPLCVAISGSLISLCVSGRSFGFGFLIIPQHFRSSLTIPYW